MTNKLGRPTEREIVFVPDAAEIHDDEGYCATIETRLRTVFDRGSLKCSCLPALLALLIERAELTEQDLQECGLLEPDETLKNDA